MNDNNTIATFFLSHYGLVTKIALSHAPSPDLINDIIQATYVEFVGDVQDETDDEQWIPMLRRAARRVSKRLWNERQRHTPETVAKIGRHLASIAEIHFQEKIFDDEIESLNSCLDQLPSKSRKLIEQHYFMGHSALVISQQFRITARAVFKALATIRDKLRICLKNHATKNRGGRKEEGHA